MKGVIAFLISCLKFVCGVMFSAVSLEQSRWVFFGLIAPGGGESEGIMFSVGMFSVGAMSRAIWYFVIGRGPEKWQIPEKSGFAILCSTICLRARATSAVWVG